MNRTTLSNIKDSGQKSPVGNSKLKNQVQPSKNGKNPAPNNNPTPNTSLSKRQVPPTTKQKSQPLKGNPEIQPNANNSNKKDLNKNSTKGKPQVPPAKPTNTNNTPKKGAAPGNPAAPQTNNPKTNVGSKPQPKSTPKQPASGTKNATNAGTAFKKGAAPSNPSAPQTNNPKTDTGPNPQPIGEAKSPTLEQPKTPNAQLKAEQVNQTETLPKLTQADQIRLIKKSIGKALTNWKFGDAALRLVYGENYQGKLQEDYKKLRQDRPKLKMKKYEHSLPGDTKATTPVSPDEDREVLDDQKQAKILLKKNKKDLMDIEDNRYPVSTILFFTELAPHVVNAAKLNNLDANLIRNICVQIGLIQRLSPEKSPESLKALQIQQMREGIPDMSLESLDMLQIAFRRLLNPQVLQAFRDHINDYLQQIQAAQGDEALQSRIEERLQAFVYNFLVPPY